MKTIVSVKPKRYIYGVGALSVVVYKLNNCHEPCLVSLIEVDKGLKIFFYYIVLILGFIINLKVEYNK